MTSPPSPPNGRRRRIVVIAIIVLVLWLGWWFWPRVDQRFVGSWRIYNADDYDEWRFRGDGSGEHQGWFAGDPPLQQTHPFRWYFDGKAIVIRGRYGDWIDQIPLGIVVALSKTRFAIDNTFSIHPVYLIEQNRIRAEMFETAGTPGENAG